MSENSPGPKAPRAHIVKIKNSMVVTVYFLYELMDLKDVQQDLFDNGYVVSSEDIVPIMENEEIHINSNGTIRK